MEVIHSGGTESTFPRVPPLSPFVSQNVRLSPPLGLGLACPPERGAAFFLGNSLCVAPHSFWEIPFAWLTVVIVFIIVVIVVMVVMIVVIVVIVVIIVVIVVMVVVIVVI